MSKNDTWKQLERDTSDYFDALLKKQVEKLTPDQEAVAELSKAGVEYSNPNHLDITPHLNSNGKLIKRNVRGDDFGRTDSDIDVVTPVGLTFESIDMCFRGRKQERLHNIIGGPIIVESKYRQGNVIPKLFNDFCKTRPSAFLTPMMLLSCNGKHYLARWLRDFQHMNWMSGLQWSDIWITSKRLNKTNTYIEEWMKQAEAYFPAKAKQYDVEVSEFHPLIATRGRRTQVLVIQRLPESTIS